MIGGMTDLSNIDSMILIKLVSSYMYWFQIRLRYFHQRFL